MKREKIFYFVATGLLSLFMVFSVSNYIFNNEMIRAAFEGFGYPSYIIYPLAAAKMAGLIAVWGRFRPALTEWAYAGFFFNFVLAFFAHLMIGDGQQYGALVALILLFTSYFLYHRIYGKLSLV